MTLVMGFPYLIPFDFRTPQSIWKVITIFARKNTATFTRKIQTQKPIEAEMVKTSKKTATFTRKIQTQEPIEVEMVNLQKSKSYSYLESAFSPWRILRVCSWQPNRTLRDCENKECDAFRGEMEAEEKTTANWRGDLLASWRATWRLPLHFYYFYKNNKK
jgi:hypothetical protein